MKENCAYYDCRLTEGGDLSEILNQFEADPKTKKAFAKAIGPWYGYGLFFSPEGVEDVLIKHIDPETGRPNFASALDELRDPISRMYKGQSPYPNL